MNEHEIVDDEAAHCRSVASLIRRGPFLVEGRDRIR
jgi:hypothetical protein